MNNIIKRKKNLLITLIIFSFVFTLISGFGSVTVNAAKEWERDVFTYGTGLSNDQLTEVERLIGVPQNQELDRIIVNSSDYQRFTGKAIDDSQLYSSAIIVKTASGSGVHVYINTPENITQIKDHQYMNAAITSGITDCDIVVGSPVQVTGETALIGVYKAFESQGFEINEEATKIATKELGVVNEINQDNTENPEFNSEDFSLAIAEIKRQISEMSKDGSINIEEINVIINNVLNQYNINISDIDKEKLSEWLNEFKELDIDWDVIGQELSGLGNLISDKADDIYKWGQESGFFAKIWQAIVDFFKSIFGN